MNHKPLHPHDKAIQAFEKRFGCPPAFLAVAPGRVNLMGEHVDYNDGLVLPMAIDQAVYLAFSPSGTAQSTIVAADFSREVTIVADHLETQQDVKGRSLPGWARYPAGILSILLLHGLPAPGLFSAFSSNVPRGAGLSSSAAVEMAFLKAWQHLAGWSRPTGDLAQMGQQAESEYVGVRCGIMDQYTSLAGKAGHALLLDCRSIRHRDIPIPDGAVIVVADSRIRHSLAGSEYNHRRASCDEAVNQLRRYLPGIRALRDVNPSDLESLIGYLSGDMRAFAHHVVREIDRTQQAAYCLANGDLAGFGQLMLESQASLREDYRVSCSQLDTLVAIAIGLPGCYGARLTGAGFGGSTVNLVRQDAVPGFCKSLRTRYLAATGLRAVIRACRPSGGAGVVLV